MPQARRCLLVGGRPLAARPTRCYAHKQRLLTPLFFHIRTVFVLARFCGLRIPHEALALKWDDIDFETRRIRIAKATKTGSRVVPMLGAVQELETQYNLSTKSGYVFVRARASAATTWRGWLLDAIKNAGLHGWEKLWVNLRASARTDAGNKFASHTCKEWFGHSTRVAEEHYLMLTSTDWSKAFELSEKDTGI